MTLLFLSSLALASTEDYQKLTGHEKREYLWQKSLQTQISEQLPALSNKGWNSVIRALRALSNLPSTFNREADELEKARIKIIHSYGSLAKIKFISNKKHPYTGILKSGALGLARFSLAANPETNKSYIPGIALKFLIDGKASLNVMAMNNLKGQAQNHNWFAYEFSTQIPAAKDWKLKIIEYIFSLVHSPCQQTSHQTPLSK